MNLYINCTLKKAYCKRSICKIPHILRESLAKKKKNGEIPLEVKFGVHKKRRKGENPSNRKGKKGKRIGEGGDV